MLWFKIDFHSGVPAYQQIIDKIKELIISGNLQADDPLPSIRELAKELNVNPNTVARSYRDLETEGYIYSRPGVGSFISAQNEQTIKNKALSLIKEELYATLLTAQKYNLNKATISSLIDQLIREVYGGE
ncbi:MAG: GntR family transcriptional regulator [Syntrophomonadaceae bacterium]|nr:GntR family transcriptional regulator [Syntrophomonadaceae bacterium]